MEKIFVIKGDELIQAVSEYAAKKYPQLKDKPAKFRVEEKFFKDGVKIVIIES